MTINTGTIPIGDGQIYYETAGEGPALVMLHAGFVDSRMWDGQWEDFSRDHHVIRYDLRGYGRSSRLERPVSRRDDLYRVLTGLGVERAALLGCSMSGETAIDFTLERPEMVTALIPVSAVPSGFEMQGPPPADLLEMMAAVEQGDLQRASELQIRIWVDGPTHQAEQVDPQVRKRAAEMNRIPVENGTWGKADSRPLDPLDPPAVKRLDQIHVPTLIITGGLDNSEILRAGDWMAAQIRGAKRANIEGAAHVPNMEKPAEFNRIVREFLEGM